MIAPPRIGSGVACEFLKCLKSLVLLNHATTRTSNSRVAAAEKNSEVNDRKPFAYLVGEHTFQLLAYMMVLTISAIAGVKGSLMAAEAETFDNSNQIIQPISRREMDYYNSALAFSKNQDWDKAIGDFNEVIRLNATNALAYEWRGCAYFALGNLEKAISDFSQVIQLNPTNTQAYLNRGNAHRVRKNYGKAVHDFNECLRLNPTWNDALKNRASTFEASGRLDEAMLDWTKLLEINPKDSVTIAARGHTFSKKGEFGKAVLDYVEAIRLDAGNAEAHNNLGWLYATCPIASMRDGKAAVRAATKACELTNWSWWEYIDTLAAAYGESGDFRQAVKYQKQAIGMKNVGESERKDMRHHLSLYEQQQAFIDGPKR